MSEGVPLVAPLMKAKLEVMGNVGTKVKTAIGKKWESVKATGAAMGSIVAAPIHIVSKKAAIKLDALKGSVASKGAALKKTISQKLATTTTTTTTTLAPPSKDLHQIRAKL
uniref:Uncharacterized protein n=1 Tax=Megaselia scalaris TaxID=36166 RepID=T1GXE0_MEGSC